MFLRIHPNKYFSEHFTNKPNPNTTKTKYVNKRTLSGIVLCIIIHRFKVYYKVNKTKCFLFFFCCAYLNTNVNLI